MAEWSKAHDWKSCIPPKGIQGSNPCLSANNKKHPCGVFLLIKFYLFSSKLPAIQQEKKMIPYLIASLIIGFLIPYIARRFAKFMPATFAGAIVELFRLEKKHPLFRKTTQYHQFIWRSIVSSVILFATTYLAFNHFDKHGFGFVFSLISLLLLMAEIDYRTVL